MTEVREIGPGANVWGDGRPYKHGDDSWAVVPLQMGLNRFGNQLALDGRFGPMTEKVVRSFQSHRGLVADGVAGPRTQETLVVSLTTKAARDRNLPIGLLRGLTENESSFMLAAYTPHPADRGFDLGVLQDAYEGPGSQEQYLHSLDVVGISQQVAGELRARHDRYAQENAGDRLAWECATLAHNWPVAADRMARGLPPTTRPDEPVEWVVDATGGRLSTPREWCAAYIASATKYVAW